MKFGCSFGIFLNSAHLVCRSTDISKCFRGPFDFEIMRVDCINNLAVDKMSCRLHASRLSKILQSRGRMGSCYSSDYRKILCIGTDRSQQTVQTKIRLLLKKQSDQGLRCLPFHQHLLDAFMQCYIKLFYF